MKLLFEDDAVVYLYSPEGKYTLIFDYYDPKNDCVYFSLGSRATNIKVVEKRKNVVDAFMFSNEENLSKDFTNDFFSRPCHYTIYTDCNVFFPINLEKSCYLLEPENMDYLGVDGSEVLIVLEETKCLKFEKYLLIGRDENGEIPMGETFSLERFTNISQKNRRNSDIAYVQDVLISDCTYHIHPEYAVEK